MDNMYYRDLDLVLKDDGTEGSKEVYKKFGASTTLHQQMEKRWNGTFDSIGTYLSKKR